MKRFYRENDVILWKTATVDVENENYMFILYYYHTIPNQRAKGFYKCAIKIDTFANWNNLIETLISENPAELFRNSMIGIDDDYNLHYAKRTFTKFDMHRWMGSRFSKSKIISLSDFLKTQFGSEIKEQFPRKFIIDGIERDISDVDLIPNGTWYTAFREKGPRKSYGRIIH